MSSCFFSSSFVTLVFRYLITKENKIILASEVGVVPQIDESRVLKKGRLEPGKILVLDFERQCIIDDNDIKSELASSLPYQKWVKEETITLKNKSTNAAKTTPRMQAEVLQKLQAFGYTQEAMDLLMVPMVEKGTEVWDFFTSSIVFNFNCQGNVFNGE